MNEYYYEIVDDMGVILMLIESGSTPLDFDDYCDEYIVPLLKQIGESHSCEAFVNMTQIARR